MLQRADRLVGRDVDGLAGLAMVFPVVPRPHQRVLQDGQLILIVAELVQQPANQPRRDLAAAHGDRTGDRQSDLVAGHPRHQVLAVVDRLRQPRVLHAVADEVGSHRQHDVDRQRGLASRFEQELDERDRFVAGVLDQAASAEAKQLLELIDDHEEVVAGRDSRVTDGVDEPERAAAQRRLQHHAVWFRPASPVVGAEHAGLVERLGQVCQSDLRRAGGSPLASSSPPRP